MKKRKDGRYALQRKIDGKVVTFYGATPAECYRKIDEYKTESQRMPTFAEITDMWYNDKWNTFSPGTQNCYRSAMERALESFGDVPADEVTAADVQALLDSLADKKYSSKSVKTQKSVISTIYRHATTTDRQLRFPNPATQAVVERGLPKSVRQPPSDEAIAKIMTTDHEWIYPKVLLYTGLRRGEALALCYEDFDHKNNLINVDKEIIYKGNQPILVQRTKTQAGTRKTIFPDPLKPLIPKGKKGQIFATTLRQFKTLWKHYCADLGISITPHQLRHAYASILYDAGIDVKDAQELLGHSDIAVTQNIYTHIRSQRKQQSIDKLNAYLAKNQE